MKKENAFKIVFIAVIAVLLVVLLAVLFTADTVTVVYNSIGGEFNGEEHVLVNPYTEQSEIASVNAYNQQYTLSVRKNSVLSLPEPAREGHTFEGWYFATVNEDGTLEYTEQFTDKCLRTMDLDKDATVNVYAKWKVTEVNSESNGLFKTPSKKSILGALQIMWKGMLGIFIVLGIIFLCIVVLNTVTNPEKRAALIAKIKGNSGNNADNSNK